jgi:hypothetical protein
MNAKAGEPITKLTKFSRPQLLEVIRVWREQTMPELGNQAMSSDALPTREQERG